MTELGVGAVNEQILRLMQSLGIDPARTKEVRGILWKGSNTLSHHTALQIQTVQVQFSASNAWILGFSVSD